MLETSHCRYIDAHILFIGRLTSTLDNFTNKLPEMWLVIVGVCEKSCTCLWEVIFVNIESEHLYVHFNIGILDIVILVTVVMFILITVINLQ